MIYVLHLPQIPIGTNKTEIFKKDLPQVMKSYADWNVDILEHIYSNDITYIVSAWWDDART